MSYYIPILNRCIKRPLIDPTVIVDGDTQESLARAVVSVVSSSASLVVPNLWRRAGIVSNKTGQETVPLHQAMTRMMRRAISRHYNDIAPLVIDILVYCAFLCVFDQIAVPSAVSPIFES